MKQIHDTIRVAMLGDYPQDRTQIRGGVQAVMAYLVQGLIQINNVEVHVFTFKQPDLVGQKRILENGLIEHYLPIFPALERARNYRTYLANLKFELAKIHPSLIHAQDATAHAYVALRSGYPTVVTAHGVRREDGKYYGSFSRRLRNYFDSWLVERYIMSHTRYLIATGHYVTDYFAHLLRPDIQVNYIWNAVDERYFDLVNASDSHTILFAGRVIPRKRVLDLVLAFARIAHHDPLAHLRIVGECSTEPVYVELILNVIAKHNLQDRVLLTGAVADILSEFAGCDVLVLPSAEETSPMVIAQAMSAGKPVVATRVGAVAEMLAENERGILVKVGDVDNIAQALLCLLGDPGLRVRLGQAGRNFAEENHRIEKVAQRTYQVYQGIVADARASDA